MAKKAMKAKGRAILRAKETIHPPNFNYMDYKLSMVHALNYYNNIDDDKKKRSWAYAYWKQQGHDVKPLDKLSDSWFHTVGAVAHMVTNEMPIHESDVIKLDSAYGQMMKMAMQEKEVETPTKSTEPKKSIQDYMNEVASEHIGEFEGAIDILIQTGDVLETKAYLTYNQVKAPVAKRIGDWAKTKYNEYKGTLDDKELTDAYGGKRIINRVVSFLEQIVADCSTMAQIAKTTRAPRKRKPQPPSKIVAKMKWMREFIDLGMKSIFPEKIIGSSEVWLYDTAKRRIVRYVSQDGYELSVKGTTLLNWDPEKSGSKIVRKPEILKGYENHSKRPMNNIFNEIKGVVGRVNGRTNENQIILKVF